MQRSALPGLRKKLPEARIPAQALIQLGTAEMTWLEAMKRDAVAVADPDFTLEPGDEVEVHVHGSDGYGSPNDQGDTYDDPFFSFEVIVTRGKKLVMYKEFTSPESAARFFQDLMKRGA